MSGRRRRPDLAVQRAAMVERHVVGGGIRDERVIAAMLAVPRHLFVDEALASRAYENAALPIGHGQTISRPFVVALMTELLDPAEDHDVLEIGTGSGYQAAVLARLCRRVHSIERLPEIAARARRALAAVHADNVFVNEGDGSLGLARWGPYPRLMVTAGSPALPPALVAQLAEGGRMVVPVAEDGGGERLQVVEKHGDRLQVTRSVPCSFVPLVGEQGHGGRPGGSVVGTDAD